MVVFLSLRIFKTLDNFMKLVKKLLVILFELAVLGMLGFVVWKNNQTVVIIEESLNAPFQLPEEEVEVIEV